MLCSLLPDVSAGYQCFAFSDIKHSEWSCWCRMTLHAAHALYSLTSNELLAPRCACRTEDVALVAMLESLASTNAVVVHVMHLRILMRRCFDAAKRR